MGSGYIFISPNKTVILTTEIYWSNYEVWEITINKDEKLLYDLSTAELKLIRNKEIDKNLENISGLEEEDVKNCKKVF